MRIKYIALHCVVTRLLIRHVIIEIPHYASMRGHERDITIMRSEDGIKWREHTTSSTEQDIISAFGSSFEGEGTIHEFQEAEKFQYAFKIERSYKY